MMYCYKRYRADKRRLRRRMSGVYTAYTGRVCLALVALVAIAMLLWMGIASAEPAWVAVTTGTLNIRWSPSLDADIEYQYERGDSLEMLSVDADGWATVQIGMDELYCRAEYLSTVPLEATEAGYKVTSNGRVHVRTSPEGDPTGRYVHDGDPVTVTAWQSGWAYVGTGWVDGTYLREEGEAEENKEP